MAVYERSYHPYSGPLTEQHTRFLTLPRYSYRDIFQSKGFIVFFCACYLWPLVLGVLIYASYNVKFLSVIAQMTGQATQPGQGPGGLVFDGLFFFYWFMIPQFWMCFFLAFIVGPALISADLRNNGLPLYLGRPFGRSDYIMGKASVLVILLSWVSWVPGLALFLLHGYLAQGGWLWKNLHIGFAILAGAAINIALLSVISLALSAYVKWKPLARLALFGVFILGSGLGTIINGILNTQWGSLINLGELLHVAWASLFRVKPLVQLSAPAAWLSLALICAFFLTLLVRRIRAYEVVS